MDSKNKEDILSNEPRYKVAGGDNPDKVKINLSQFAVDLRKRAFEGWSSKQVVHEIGLNNSATLSKWEKGVNKVPFNYLVFLIVKIVEKAKNNHRYFLKEHYLEQISNFTADTNAANYYKKLELYKNGNYGIAEQWDTLQYFSQEFKEKSERIKKETKIGTTLKRNLSTTRSTKNLSHGTISEAVHEYIKNLYSVIRNEWLRKTEPALLRYRPKVDFSNPNPDPDSELYYLMSRFNNNETYSESSIENLLNEAGFTLSKSEEKEIPPISLVDYLEKTKKYILLGHPGEGKSTSLFWLFKYFAESWYPFNPIKSTELNNNPAFTSIPLLIILNRWQTNIENFEDFLNKQVRNYSPRLAKFLPQLLETEKIILLLDGFDELLLAQKDYESNKQEIENIIQNNKNNNTIIATSNNRLQFLEELRNLEKLENIGVVMSCRYYDFKDQLNWPLISILPLNLDDIKSVANSFFASFPNSEFLANEFVSDLFDKPWSGSNQDKKKRLQSLAANPFYLRWLLSLYLSNIRSNKSNSSLAWVKESDLLKVGIDEILERLIKPPSTRKAIIESPSEANRLKEQLKLLAFNMTDAGRTFVSFREACLLLLERRPYEDRLHQMNQKLRNRNKLFEEPDLRSDQLRDGKQLIKWGVAGGLLKQEGINSGVEFTHLLFQEYLSALYCNDFLSNYQDGSLDVDLFRRVSNKTANFNRTLVLWQELNPRFHQLFSTIFEQQDPVYIGITTDILYEVKSPYLYSIFELLIERLKNINPEIRKISALKLGYLTYYNLPDSDLIEKAVSALLDLLYTSGYEELQQVAETLALLTNSKIQGSATNLSKIFKVIEDEQIDSVVKVPAILTLIRYGNAISESNYWQKIIKIININNSNIRIAMAMMLPNITNYRGSYQLLNAIVNNLYKASDKNINNQIPAYYLVFAIANIAEMGFSEENQSTLQKAVEKLSNNLFIRNFRKQYWSAVALSNFISFISNTIKSNAYFILCIPTDSVPDSGMEAIKKYKKSLGFN